MELRKSITENESIIRIASTVVLAIIALRSVTKGKRLRGLLAAGGAVAVGSTVSTLKPAELAVMSDSEEGETESSDTESSDMESTTASTIEEGSLQCSVCSGPIAPGQSRRPNENDEIAHEACLQPVA